MQRLVLAGGGHSHIEVLLRFAADFPPNTQLTVIGDSPWLVYTGMLPGVVAGIYPPDLCKINVEELATRARARWICSALTGLDADAKTLRLANGTQLPFEWLSLNTGAIPPRDAMEGTSNRMISIKPMHEFVRWWEALLAQGHTAFPLKIGIIGAGAGGVELALAIEHRLRKMSGRKPFGEVFLVTEGRDILPAHNWLVRRWLRRILAERRVAVHMNAKVVATEASCLHCADGRIFDFDHAIWATGAAPETWLGSSGLATDARGFVAINNHLQSISHPEVFAAGDVAGQIKAHRPKSGVFAVRQGPVLSENLRRSLMGTDLLDYEPQGHALALIGTGERYAVASRGLVALKGKWVWRWKEKIDRAFIGKYRV